MRVIVLIFCPEKNRSETPGSLKLLFLAETFFFKCLMKPTYIFWDCPGNLSFIACRPLGFASDVDSQSVESRKGDKRDTFAGS